MYNPIYLLHKIPKWDGVTPVTYTYIVYRYEKNISHLEKIAEFINGYDADDFLKLQRKALGK